MYLTTTGIVLRETIYKESDKLLTVLTRDLGKKTIKARGCRRKNSKLAASAQLLVYSELTLFERQERFTLHEGNSLNQFWGLRADVELLSLAAYFAELLDVVVQEGVSHPELLSLLLNSLYALDTLKKEPALVKAAFELSLLCRSGYEPMLDGCAVCGNQNPESPRLHLREGVLHCADCRHGVGEGISMPVTAGALAAMRHIAWGDPKKLFSFRLDAQSLQQLGELTEAFLLTQLERGFHTLDFYKATITQGFALQATEE